MNYCFHLFKLLLETKKKKETITTTAAENYIYINTSVLFYLQLVKIYKQSKLVILVILSLYNISYFFLQISFLLDKVFLLMFIHRFDYKIRCIYVFPFF